MRSPKTTSPRTGIFAELGAILHSQGPGAPLTVLAVTFALAGLLVFTAPPALAALSVTFTGAGSGAGQVSAADGVAVDQLSGTVYVPDANNRRVNEFEANGTFIRAFGYGVVNGANELQVCTTATGCREGLLSGLFPTAVAVDNSTNPLDLSKGDVYVSNGVSSSVDKFSPAGMLLLTFGSSGTGPGQFSPAVRNEFAPLPAAVDVSGDVWVGDRNRIEQFTPEGAFISEVKLPGLALVKTLAIDTDPSSSSSGDFYASDERRNESQEIIPPASGSYTLSFEGQTTASLSFNATSAEIKAALEALSTIGAGNVAVSSVGGGGGNAKNFEVGLVGALGDRILPLMTASAGAVKMLEEGASGHLLKLKPDGSTVATLDEAGEPQALGLDPATGDLFVADLNGGNEVNLADILLEYGPSGAQLERFGAGEVLGCCGSPRSNALAFGDTANALYVVSSNAAQIFTLPAPGPLVRGGSTKATEIGKTSATLNATVNSEGKATTFHFQYITEEKFNEDGETFGAGTVTTPESPPIGEDFAEHSASALTSLKFGTNYRFRVIATNSDGVDTGETGAFTTLPPLRIDSTSASGVTATSATIEARINPLGEAVTYHFEYLTEAAYRENGEGFSGPQSAVSVPQPDASIGSGQEDVDVIRHLQGLSPDTVYRYRVVAVDSIAPEGIAGAAPAFATQGSGGPLVLPDAREWEMVSPPDKFGAALLPTGQNRPIQAATGGGAITYLATAPTEGEPVGNSNDPQVLSLRRPNGWISRDITIPHSEAVALSHQREYPYFSEDVSLGILQPQRAFNPSLSAEASEQTAYLRSDYLDGDVGDPCTELCYRPLVTGAAGFANVPEGTEFGVCEVACAHAKSTTCPPALRCGPQFIAASPDLSHVVLRSQVVLKEGAPVTKEGLYEWSNGQLTFIGIGQVGNPSQFPEEGIAARHAVSDDGSRVVFTGKSEGVEGLLMRDTATGDTLKLDAAEPQCLSQHKCVSGGGHFETASSDGSKVFFTDSQRLTADSGAVSGNENGPGLSDLYQCEITEVEGKLHCDLSDLTPEAFGENANVQAPVIGASEDGAYVYFVSDGKLTSEAVHGTCVGQTPSPESTCNLYLDHDGKLTLVAILSGEDAPDWGKNIQGEQKSGAGLQVMTARVSPDGRRLAFMSDRPLTGYDNHDAVSGRTDEEVYLYDASAGPGEETLTCASCNPTGGRPHGVEYAQVDQQLTGGFENTWPDDQWLAASVPGWTTALHQPRYLSNSGRLFFDSSDALVPQDSNHAEDVYEYEPLSGGQAPASDKCTVQSSTYSRLSGGCVALISSGTSREESAFLDASENGDDVFFLTAAKLSSQDTDSALDVYDAHVCSAASPCLPAPPPGPPACEGDACQSPGGAPEDPTPGSLTFQGPGNITPLASPPLTKPRAEPLTRAQKLANARRACRKKPKKKRAGCERQAEREFGATKAKKAIHRKVGK